MKRPEPTARTLRRQERTQTKNFLLLLLFIVGVVALVQVLLILTMTRLGTGSANFLEHVRQAPALVEAGSRTT